MGHVVHRRDCELIGFSLPYLDRVLHNVAIKCHINSCCMRSKVTCHILHKHISVFSKHLHTRGYPRVWMSPCPLIAHTCLYVSFWNFLGCVKSSHQNADQHCLWCRSHLNSMLGQRKRDCGQLFLKNIHHLHCPTSSDSIEQSLL